jgi:hypothetical protein
MVKKGDAQSKVIRGNYADPVANTIISPPLTSAPAAAAAPVKKRKSKAAAAEGAPTLTVSEVAPAKAKRVRKPKTPAVDAGLAALEQYRAMKASGMKRGSYITPEGERIVRAGELKAPKLARHERDAKGAFRKVKEAGEDGNVISHIVADYGLSALKAMKAMANKEKKYKGKEAVAELRSYKATVKAMRSDATSKTTQARVAAESAKALRAEAKDLRKKAKEMMEAGKNAERQAFSPAGLARYVSDSESDKE